MGDTVNVYGPTSLTYRQYTFHHWPDNLINITSLAVPISENVAQKTSETISDSATVGAIDSSDMVVPQV